MENCNDIDSKIREALASDNATHFDPRFDEQSLFAQALQLFQGRNRWFNGIVVAATLVFIGLSGYSAYQFYWAVEVKELITWASAFMLGLLFVSGMKIWAWMEMEKYSTIREIKRLELQVVRLVDQLRNQQNDR